MTVDISDERHRQSVLQAWSDYADGRKIIELGELSAMVSTNRVYRLQLDDGGAIIAKSSN